MSPLTSPSETPAVADHPDGSASAMPRLLVAIDGPAGTGKSSVARGLALRLGLDFLDTGAMYRAATALALDLGIDLSDEVMLADVVRSADLCFDWTTDPPTLHAFGRSIMHRLRDADVSAQVSPVSSLAAVREVLVERQRRIGEVHRRLVSEGRDQGSVVFHDADVKVYLDASPKVRARRRAEQLARLGQPGDLAVIEREIAERDRRDSTRAVGPLVCPEDAVRLMTDDLDQEGVIDELVRIVRARAGSRL